VTKVQELCAESLAAAEGYKSTFSSPLEQKIFLEISKRYLTKETAEQIEAERQQQENDRVYYESFRIDVLRIMHSDEEVRALLHTIRNGGRLALEQYRPGLEKAYPMFYLATGLRAFGPKRVS
jgi:hypothetical protein